MGVKYMPSDGGTWTAIPQGDAYYYDGSEWKIIKKGHYMPSDGGSWTQFYTGSDEREFTIYPNGFSTYATRFARGSSWGTTSNGPSAGTAGVKTLACGRYFTGSNTPRYYGVATFAFTSVGTFFSSELAERPVVKSATLRLTRDTVLHGEPTPSSSNIYVSPYDGNTTTTSPSTSDVDLSKAVSASSTGLARGSNIEITLDQDIIDHVAANSDLAITNVNSGLADFGSSLDTNYFFFFGLGSTSTQPRITVTLDYV